MDSTEELRLQVPIAGSSDTEVTLRPIGEKEANSVCINGRNYRAEGKSENVAVFQEQLKKLPSKDYPSLKEFTISLESAGKSVASTAAAAVSVFDRKLSKHFVEKILLSRGSKQEILEIVSQIPAEKRDSHTFTMDIALALAERGAAIKACHMFCFVSKNSPEEMDSSFFRMGNALLESGKRGSNVDCLNCAFNYFTAIKLGSPSPPAGLQDLIDQVLVQLKTIASNEASPFKNQAAEIAACIEIKEALGDIPVGSKEELDKLRSENPKIDAAFVKAEAIQARADAERIPAPGKIVSIRTSDGEMLPMHINITGKRRPGEPLVILEGGLGMISSDWHLVQKNMPKDLQVMSYDRAGTGWSGRGTQKATAENALSNLEEILRSQGLDPPYIFVGHSYGGFLGQLFTLRHPEQIAGLVLVDSAIEEHLPGEDPPNRIAFDYIPPIAQNSFFRNDLAHFMEEEESPVIHRLKSKTENMATYREELREFTNSANLLEAGLSKHILSRAPPFKCPMKVITATNESLTEPVSEDPVARARWADWITKQHRLRERSTDTVEVLAEHSDHFIMYHQPELIISQIRSIFRR